jgi:hypothetical protein
LSTCTAELRTMLSMFNQCVNALPILSPAALQRRAAWRAGRPGTQGRRVYPCGDALPVLTGS